MTLPQPPTPTQDTVDQFPTPELLDELLAAIQASDKARQSALYQQHPQLKNWSGCLDLLDNFSATIAGPAAAPTAETTLGKFQLLEELGRGGMGVVYKARQTDLQRIVAVKMILSSHLATADEVRRFQTEARAAACVRHRNIVGIHEIGEQDGRHYFVMDYVEGQSLATRLRRGTLPPEDAAKLLIQLAQAVEHLHSQGVIHRDLKPSNILIDQQGEPFVTDFGLAKVFDADGGQTRSGAIVGTPSYMSPEQAAGRNSEISPRSDVYSLGAMLYEMLTGRPPFREDTVLDTLVQVLEGEPTLPCRLNPAISRDLELICLRCLDKDPAKRYPSAASLAADLGRYLNGESVEARSGWIPAIRRWMRRQPGLACHWGAQGAAALIMQIHFMLLGERVHLVTHCVMIGIVSGWAALSFLCQFWLDRDSRSLYPHLGNIITDVLLLTMALAISTGPVSTLLVIYPLLITASGLWFQVRLVWVTTVTTAVGLLVLVWMKPELAEPLHYPLLVLTVLAAVGAATAYQVKRVRALSRFYERRPVIS